MGLDDFREVWLVKFDADQPPGDLPHPVGLTAHEFRSGRRLRLGRPDLLAPSPPYSLGPDALFVA